MTQNYVVNLNADNKEYANAKDAAWNRVLDARDAVADMRRSLVKSGMTPEDWQMFRECDQLYESMSKMLKKINNKF